MLAQTAWRRPIRRRGFFAIALAVTVGWFTTPAVQAATEVSGTIAADTTWTAANSPYLLTTDVLVDPNVTLTVEPGVQVNAQVGAGSGGRYTNVELEVRGALNASGTASAPIGFGPSTPGGAGWGGVTLASATGKSQFDHVTLGQSRGGLWLIGSDAAIRNSRFDSNQSRHVLLTGTRTWDTSITSSVFDTSHLSFPTNGSTAINVQTGGAGTVTIAGNSIFKNDTGIDAESSGPVIDVLGNGIHHNDVGLRFNSPRLDAQHNSILSNRLGVRTFVGGDVSGLVFAHNDLADNTEFNWDFFGNANGHANVSAPDNWWGSTEPEAIDASINDGNDDFLRGTLSYVPSLASADGSSPKPVIPDTTITDGPPEFSYARVPSFSFVSSESASTFECRLDTGDWTRCESPHTRVVSGDGPHVFAVRAIGPTGWADPSEATRTWTLDTTLPVTSIVGGPSELTRDDSPSFSFTAEDGAHFDCKMDLGSWAPCPTPQPYVDLSDGWHSFSVQATDRAGNLEESPRTSTFTVDTQAPQTAILSGPPGRTSSSSANFVFAASESGASFRCSLDGGRGGPARHRAPTPGSPTAPTCFRCTRPIRQAMTTPVRHPSPSRSTPLPRAAHRAPRTRGPAASQPIPKREHDSRS